MDYEKISWAGSYLVESEYLDSDKKSYRDIPVIEGDQVDVQCKARVVEGDSKYNITCDPYKHFNTSTRGEMMMETSEDGVIKYYVVDPITVNILDATTIDDESIFLTDRHLV